MLEKKNEILSQFNFDQRKGMTKKNYINRHGLEEKDTESN